MSRQNVDLVLSLYKAVQEREYESPFTAVHEDIVWDMSGLAIPDVAQIYRGHDGLRAFWASWLAAWESIEFDVRSAEDLGDEVVVEVHQRNRGRGSGVPVEFDYFQIFELRDGKIATVWVADSRDEALKGRG